MPTLEAFHVRMYRKARDALRVDHLNLHLPRRTIRFRSGFSGRQWLCCSTFALIARSWPENLLRLHLIYQQRYTPLSIWLKFFTRYNLIQRLLADPLPKCLVTLELGEVLE